MDFYWFNLFGSMKIVFLMESCKSWDKMWRYNSLSIWENVSLKGYDQEMPILKLIGASSVKGIEHSPLTDSLAAPKKNAQLEIAGFDDQIKSSVLKRLQMWCKFSLKTLAF